MRPIRSDGIAGKLLENGWSGRGKTAAKSTGPGAGALSCGPPAGWSNCEAGGSLDLILFSAFRDMGRAPCEARKRGEREGSSLQNRAIRRDPSDRWNEATGRLHQSLDDIERAAANRNGHPARPQLAPPQIDPQSTRLRIEPSVSSRHIRESLIENLRGSSESVSARKKLPVQRQVVDAHDWPPYLLSSRAVNPAGLPCSRRPGCVERAMHANRRRHAPGSDCHAALLLAITAGVNVQPPIICFQSSTDCPCSGTICTLAVWPATRRTPSGTWSKSGYVPAHAAPTAPR